MNQSNKLPERDHELDEQVDDRALPANTAITLGERLRLVRKELGYSRARLADITGISASTLKGYESGNRVNPRTGSLKGFAKARINVHWLLGAEHAPMLLESVESAEKTADYAASLLGDENAQRRMDEAHQATMSRLGNAREMVERVANELKFQPSSVIMGALVASAGLGRISEEGVRDVLRAVMVQAVLDRRS